MSKEPSMSQGESACDIAETSMGMRTCFSNADLQKRAQGKVVLQNALNINK